MTLLSLLLLLGVCFSHWLTASPVRRKGYLWFINRKGILKGISAVNSYHLDLSFENIKYISKNAFNHIPDTIGLDLSNNNLKLLRPYTFSKLNNLEELSLADNALFFINRPFIGLNNLKYLDLSNNPKLSFTRGALFGLTNSTNIITEGTEIPYISSRIFQDPSVPAREFGKHVRARKKLGYAEEPPLLDNSQVKICMTDYGLVTSVERMELNGTIGDCIEATVFVKEQRLVLTNLGLKEFQRGWYKLSGDFIKELDLSSNFITDITPQLLNDLPSNISTIYLDHNKIWTVKRNVIENRFLRELSLEYNPLSKIEDMAFGRMNLTSLSVGVTRLRDMNFVKTLPPTIEYFYFFYNKITELPVDTFRGLKNLKRISLMANHFEIIEPGTFEEQKNLTSLELMANRIKKLNPGIFKGLKMLNEINFVRNEIEEISSGTFSELRNLSDLNIYLAGNKIRKIEDASFSNMNITKLVLSSNKITDESIAEGAFNNCTLGNLVLRQNLMTKINGKLFEGILSSYALSLSKNQIRTIKKGDVKNMNNVRSLSLNENPLERLENGALYGLSKDTDVFVHLRESPIKLIQGGLFNDV